MRRPRDELIARISVERARLAELQEREKRAKRRLSDLENQLARLDPPSHPDTDYDGIDPPIPVSNATEKVMLFRSLFRGRPDVFSTRFVSKKTGKAGYAPSCANKFVRGVCDLPKVKCGECMNQAFHSAGDQAVLKHLQGHHVMGVYPLLEDETCWFLAADFDKASWRADVTAFADTCRAMNVPVYLERSRSGNGAHAWIFFSSPVPATVARKMGCHLITQTMSRHHELGMESYDRLFPNQDTMQRGGFGNLIALPLQLEARKQGNTEFLDDSLEPLADQWTYLASISRVTPPVAARIAQEATRSGQVLGVRLAEPGDKHDDAPWKRPPSGRVAPDLVPESLPREVRGVIAQKLFVDKTGLPSALLDRIKRIAAFQNPEFYKKQKMRLSTAQTPRVVSCAEELPQHISLPRGCRPDVEDLLRAHDVALTLKDERCTGEPLDVEFQGELTALQQRSAAALLQHDIGVSSPLRASARPSLAPT